MCPDRATPHLKIGRGSTPSNQGGDPRTFARKLVGDITPSPFRWRLLGQILASNKQINSRYSYIPLQLHWMWLWLFNLERILPSFLRILKIPRFALTITSCYVGYCREITSWPRCTDRLSSKCGPQGTPSNSIYSWLSLLFRSILNLFLQPPYSNSYQTVTIIIFHVRLWSKRGNQISLQGISCCPQKHVKVGGGIWEGKPTQSVWI